MCEKRNAPPDVAGYLRDNPELPETYRAVEEEGWIYLRHAERQNVQRVLNAVSSAYVINMNASMDRANDLARERAEQIGWLEGQEPKQVRTVDPT